MTATADIRRFRIKTKAGAEAVFKQSVQDVLRIAQTPKNAGGRMPVKDGILRNSLQSRLNGTTIMTGEASYTAALAGWSAGDVIEAGWTTDYARRMEYGFVGTDSLGRTYNQAGNFFVRNAVLEWPRIVAENARRVSML